MAEITDHDHYNYLVFLIPARGLFGLRTRLLNATQGTAILHHRFDCYKPMEGEIMGRSSGVLVSMVPKAVGFALDNLQDRAEMFVTPGDEVYEGMIVGENSRSEDMPVNPTKEKKLTNMCAAHNDENIILKPPRLMTLEAGLEYIAEDEVVEVTPSKIRLRKILLSQNARKKLARNWKRLTPQARSSVGNALRGVPSPGIEVVSHSRNATEGVPYRRKSAVNSLTAT